MIKKIKGLAALWLALIMVLTMMPVMSAENTQSAEDNHIVMGGGVDECVAWYQDPKQHWVTDWDLMGSGGAVCYVGAGETATLPNHPRICEEYAEEGYAWIFKGWDMGNGERLPGVAQVTNKQLHEFGCYDGYVYLWAMFDYGVKVDVVNGTGDNYYADGETVTIKADTIPGKRFKKWEVAAAQVNIPRPCALDLSEDGESSSASMPEGFDETAATATFMMPGGDFRLTFTAIYENAPSNPGYDWYIPAPTEPETEPETEECWKVNCRKLNVRKAPSLFSDVIAKLERGFCIVDGELTEDGKWVRYEVEEGVYGYVSADYIVACDCLDDIVLPAEKVVVCRKLNVRSGAGTSYGKLGQLTRGETVKIVSCDCSGWVKIEYNGGYAWISAAYIG